MEICIALFILIGGTTAAMTNYSSHSVVGGIKTDSEEIESETISCDKFENDNWMSGSLKTCIVTRKTKFLSVIVYITPTDSSILALDLSFNKELTNLPIDIHNTFPEILAYKASHCSIETISKMNFYNMLQLTELRLNDNQIEKIDSDTFEDLVSLKYLYLSM